MRIPKKSHKAIARWVLSGVLLAAINIAMWSSLGGASTPATPESAHAEPAFWSGSILLAIGLAVVDLLWLTVLIFWLAQRKAGIPEEETTPNVPSAHPVDDPAVEQKKSEN